MHENGLGIGYTVGDDWLGAFITGFQVNIKEYKLWSIEYILLFRILQILNYLVKQFFNIGYSWKNLLKRKKNSENY